MDYYAGLDVSLEEASVCVVDGDGAVVHEAKVATEVEAIAETLRRFARSLARVALEAGPLSPRLHDVTPFRYSSRHKNSPLRGERASVVRAFARSS